MKNKDKMNEALTLINSWFYFAMTAKTADYLQSLKLPIFAIPVVQTLRMF